MAIHRGIARPWEVQGPLADPMQAEQQEQNADGQKKHLHLKYPFPDFGVALTQT
jgi:hypothetical protein